MAIKEMSAMITPPVTQYAIMIPEFSTADAVVLLVSTDSSGTYPKTIIDIAAEGASNDYTFSQSGTQWFINFSTDVVNKYIAFVVRIPYVKPYNSWTTLISNSQINYTALNNQNESIYKWFYDSYDFDYDRRLVLESTYKFEEMRVVPYLDDQFLWMKDGDKIIAIHRKDLIKDELAEINSILNTMRQIQADVINRQTDITNKWNDVMTTAAQVLIWRNDTETFYNLSLTLKNQMQTIYDDYEDMADTKFSAFLTLYNNSVTQLGNLISTGVTTINSTAYNRVSEINTIINTGKTDITNLSNTAIAEITLNKNNSLTDIEAAKNQAIKDILDAAAEIIGGDFLPRGGTTYNNAKEIEDDITELKNRPSGAAVLVAEMDAITDGNLIIKFYDSDHTAEQVISQNIQYTFVSGAGISSRSDYPVYVSINGVQSPLKRETFDGSTVNTGVTGKELIQYQTYILLYNPVSAAWYVRTNLLATGTIPGLTTLNQIYNAQYEYVDVNAINTRTNEDIIHDINKVLSVGKKARLNNFQFPVTVPYCSMYNEGILSFEVNGSGSLLLTYLPRYDSGVTRLEAIVATSNGLIPTTWQFYTRDNWKHYGGEEWIGINQTLTFNDTTSYAALTAAQCGITGSLNVFKEIILRVSIRTLRHQSSNGTVRLELSNKFRLQQNTGATSGQPTIDYLNNRSGTDVIRVWGTKSIRATQLSNNWIFAQLTNSGYSYREPIDGNCIIQIIDAIGLYY